MSAPRALAALVLALALGGPQPAAADAAAGKRKAQACTTCHGALGISQHPQAPNLAGQPRIYLVEQLKAFRAGTRTSQIMNVIAKPLSDAEIADLADWFSSIEVEATDPG